MDIRIDTKKVDGAAQYISLRNREMTNAFLRLKTTCSRQKDCWGGTAGDAALVRLSLLINNNEDPRKYAVDRFVGFLYSQVGESYECAETAVSRAASKFK